MKLCSILVSCLFFFGCAYIPQPSVKYIAFGDSSTTEYPNYLPEELGVPASEVGNQSQGGETTDKGLERLQKYVQYKTFPNGQYFLYWEGGNDLIDLIGQIDPFLLYDPTDENYPYELLLQTKLLVIKSNITQTIRLAKVQGWRVYVGTYQKMMPMNCPAVPFLEILLPKQAEIANKYQEILNAAIKETALFGGADTVNIAAYNFTINQYKNCNHLNSSGNKIVAQLWAEKIK